MRRLATPGAVVMLAGAALLYWGLGILRGDTSRTRTMGDPIGKTGTNTATTTASRTWQQRLPK